MGEETMWAVQYAEYGGPDVLRVGTVPRPRPSREQVLVEVAAFSINGADLLARRGRLRVLSGFGFPKGTGVDFAGTIRERGADVTSLRVGDRVWGYLGVKPPGAHAAAAQYVVASTDVLAVAPDSTSLSEAAALPLVGLTALKALRDALRVAAGDRVLVVGGSGGVGSTAIQIAVALGARVDAVAGSRGDVAESAGAEHVYDYRSTAPEQISARYHVILDTSGSRVGAYRGLLTRAGRIASVSPASFYAVMASAVTPGPRIRVVSAGPNGEDLRWLARAVDDGSIRPIVAGSYPRNQVEDAHRDSESGPSAGKRVVTAS
ncbi:MULTISPECIES: NAD(P)-dependent alcohol dehydrogenase [unclassified Microbacterium]|uniref:NAD(P)-dependent alcohol dehydrogenase n=1 Tax=unclassified Microbacterium TaxID=2609290 RepID=UPI00097EBB4F|nr:NAD(P)-dependent alcohol dehydrogenase [Microbacterium sp. JB110]RCS62875.1 NAD(P)-dependent alcohol dehydrogenase [Microbacterium sp. JB110]SJM61856.1 oxidoreductase [Frigoribacterium sp. JB110]